MEAYSSSYSSSKSAYLSHNPQKAKGPKHAYPFQSQSLLHSVRKSQPKPWKKAPVAPLPPTAVKVYQVDPVNFRSLVQQLTGAPEFRPQPHQQFLQNGARAATSLDVASPPNPPFSGTDIAAASSPVCNKWYLDVQSEALAVTKSRESAGGAMAPGFLDMNLASPSSCNWCSFLPMSPGTMASLELGRVLSKV